jgi:hypothetical protein
VKAGVFTPDGKRLVSAGEDRTIRVWNVATGKQEFALNAQTIISALALVGDNLLASGGEDGSILLWDLDKRQQIGQLGRHEQAIHGLAVSPDSKLLASAGGTWNKPLPGELRLWDPAKRTLIARLDGHRAQVLGLAFAPDSRSLTASDRSGDIKVWDLASRAASGFHDEKLAWSVQYSSGGKWLALGEAWGQIHLYEAATLSDDSVVRAHKGGVFSLAFAPRGNLLASAGHDGAVRLWNPLALESQPPMQIGSHQGLVWFVAFSSDGSTLASGGADGRIQFWSISPALLERFRAPVETQVKEAPVVRNRAARIALLAGPEAVSRNVLDLTLAKLIGTPEIVLVERADVERLLREQALSLSGLVDGTTAVKAGKILSADLLAVLEYSHTTQHHRGVRVFDAATGVILSDNGFTSSTLEPQALQAAAGVRAAAALWRAGPRQRKTLCFLPVRNADLPRAMDGFCEAQAAMLQRELLASGAAAVLERRRLDLVTQEKSLAADANLRDLLASLVLVSMDISRARSGNGIGATVLLRNSGGGELHRFSVEVADANGVGLLAPLARQIQGALQATPVDSRDSRNRESRRFQREAQLLWKHHEYRQGLQAAEAAFVLHPGEDARMLLTEYLLAYATGLIHPGGMRTLTWGTFKLDVPPEKLREALVLAQRALLLIDTARARLPGPNDSFELWRSVEPFAVVDAQRFFFNKLPFVVIKPADAQAEAEFVEFRRFCLRRIVAQCEECARTADRDPKALTRYTAAITKAVENIARIAPNSVEYADTLTELARRWLKLAGHYPENALPVEAAAEFGKFLGRVSEKSLLPGKPDPQAREIALKLLEQAGHFSSALVQLYARHYKLRLLVKAGRLTPEEAVGGHQTMLAEGKHLIDHPPVTPPNPFRAAMYHLLGDAIEYLYLYPKGRSVVGELLDLCEFMLARGDVVEDVIRRAVGYGSPQRDLNLRALHVIDRALEVTDSPTRRLFDGSLERFKEHEMKPARHKILTQLPDLLKLELPWQSARLLASAGDLKATLLLRTVAHEGHLYLFAGGTDLAAKHWQLQLAQVSALGGPPRVLAKTVVKEEETPDPTRSYAFWINPERFVTATVVAGNHLYAGTMTDGILGFPLTGGAPIRIGEKEGLPARHVQKLTLVGRTLVAALEGGYLVTYGLESGRCETIASSRRSEKRSPFDDSSPFRVGELAADPPRQRVLFALDLSSDRDPRAGVWEFNLQSREFKRLLPTLAARWSAPTAKRIYLFQANLYQPNRLLAYDLAEDQLLLLQGPPPAEQPQLKPMGVPAALSVTFPGWTFYPARLLHRGWIWQAHPFGRRRPDGSSEELFPSLRDNSWTYGFSAVTALQTLNDGELLIGDYAGLYLVRLKESR